MHVTSWHSIKCNEIYGNWFCTLLHWLPRCMHALYLEASWNMCFRKLYAALSPEAQVLYSSLDEKRTKDTQRQKSRDLNGFWRFCRSALEDIFRIFEWNLVRERKTINLIQLKLRKRKLSKLDQRKINEMFYISFWVILLDKSHVHCGSWHHEISQYATSKNNPTR